MQAESALNDRISAHFENLSPQLRRAAEFVANHPDEVATRSLRYLAGMAEIAPPTFSRLAATLGYDGYEDLRESCRNQIKTRRLRFSERAETLQKSDSAEPGHSEFIFRQGSAAVENINAFLGALTLERLESAATQLISARRVILAGSMSSRPFVDYMAYMASMAFDSWRVIGDKRGSTAAALVGVDEKDAAVVICKAPYAQWSIDAARNLREAGAWVIGITDEVVSPLHRQCADSFTVPSVTPQFFPSHAATLVLIESLIGIAIARGGDSVGRRIAAVESTSHRIGEYFPRGDL